MSIEQLAVGDWDFVSSEKFNEFLSAIGVGAATRLIVAKLKPNLQISIENGEWTLKTLSTFKNTELKFKVGVPFENKTPDGRTVQTTFTVDGNTLTQEDKGDVDSKIVRVFSQDQIEMTLSAKDVVSKRVYKRKA